MDIRRALPDELSAIMKIYDGARSYMAETGNPNQWNGKYPYAELLAEDIELGQCYVCVSGGEICGVFVFIVGRDPTYTVIDGGSWLNDDPYGTIHRIAASGKVPGVFDAAVAFCLKSGLDVRADTHNDNRIMQHLLERSGFKRCGIIYIETGDPRIAYHHPHI